MTRARLLFALLLFAFVTGCSSPRTAGPVLAPLPEAEAASLKSGIDALAKPEIENGRVAGLVVGVITPAGQRVFGYGTTKLGAGTRPDGRTIFEIGSVSKVFTAVAAAAMVREGTLKIEEPVASLLPEGVVVPSKDGHIITVGDLLSHNSGLPRMPANLNLEGLDPYSGYGTEQLYAGLATTELPRLPGEKVEYSNFGMGLLGHELARAQGLSWEALVRKVVGAPLGLSDTGVTLSDEQQARFADGYFLDDAEGLQPVPHWTFDALAGAGALRSTADDLLVFVAANLGLVDTPLTPTLQDTHIEQATTDAKELSIALGWHVYNVNGMRIIWHNGGTYGAYAFVAFDPSRRIGVVVLSNSFSLKPTLDALGLKTLSLLRKQLRGELATSP
jgi:serine-type D-Ala-D-Ala carboxypeptidase/endopeptidase